MPPPQTRPAKRQRVNSAPSVLSLGNGLPENSTLTKGAEPLTFPIAHGTCVCGTGTLRHSCRAYGRRAACEGDVSIVQEKYDRLFQVVLRKGGHVDTRFGRFSHDDLLEAPSGRRWVARRHATEGASGCAGFMHAIRLGPVCWGASVSHRTQIVHAHDAALITLQLELRAGSRVVEAGVGSAALTAQIAWIVGASGSVRAFEFHSGRAKAARETLAQAGLGHVVSVTDGDVVASGFLGVNAQGIDAVFLDLPTPERVVGEAARVLRCGGRVCCFSPCVEQVQRTCIALRESLVFHTVLTVTAPVRTYDTKRAQRGRREDEKEQLSADVDAERKHFGRVLRPERPIASRAFSEMKGHTSYLTFATRVARASEKLTQRNPPRMASSMVPRGGRETHNANRNTRNIATGESSKSCTLV